MKYLNYYLDVLKKYAVFEGRASRMEYWIFVLINTIIIILLSLISKVGLVTLEYHMLIPGFIILKGLYIIAVLIPGIAVSVRRLHDTDHSGFWLFISLIPMLGPLVIIIFMLMKGTPGTNKYGTSTE